MREWISGKWQKVFALFGSFNLCRVRRRYSNFQTLKTFKLCHTIRKVKFLSKNSILTKTQHFYEFFTHIFWTIFLVKSKLSRAKKSETTTFPRVFHPQKNPQFSREIKVDFLDKKSRFRTVCMHTLWNISKLFKFISNFEDSIVSCYKTNTIEKSIFWLVSWKWKWRVVQFFERGSWGSCKFWADST